jgi:hypothetical protein
MTKPITRLRKHAKRGDMGLPKATLAFYGPDNMRASKAVLGIFLRDDDEAIIHRYFSDDADARYKIDIQEDILARLREHNVRSLIMMEEILGCPHEEGIDYTKGEPCPQCPFWKGRDRFAAGDRV